MDWLQIIGILAAVGTVGGTWALVGVTWKLARGQLSLVEGHLSIAKEQLQIQLFLELRKDFDGPLMPLRKLLASQLMGGTPHAEINEPVMNFFEDIGMLIRRNYLDREIIWDTFSYHAIRWWSACKDYIANERADKSDDTLFREFEDLIETMYQDEMKKRHKTRTELEPSPSELKRFLEEESRL